MSYEIEALLRRIADLEMMLRREHQARETACRLYADAVAMCAQYKEDLWAARELLKKYENGGQNNG